MLTNLKLRTGTLGLAVKILVMPAGKDMVRSPVIFTRHLQKKRENRKVVDDRGSPSVNIRSTQTDRQTDRLCCPPLK